MSFVQDSLELTHAAALEMLRAGAASATEIGQPQCIVIVDKSGETLGVLRMTGAKFLSLKSARAKARTAAATGGQTDAVAPNLAPLLASATQGEVTSLGGGVPIYVNGVLVGGIGVGSGTQDQDKVVAMAAIEAIGGQASASS